MVVEINYGYTYNLDVPKFLEGYRCSNWVSLNYDSISSNGSSTDMSFCKSMQASIGEAFERQALINFINRPQYMVNFLNLTTDELGCEKINSKNIIYFLDTCGLATHVSSELSIENSLKEFIERQSFIISYLSKTVKYQIKKDKYLSKIIPFDLTHLKFYEISIIDCYRVILGIGSTGSNSIDIGIGAGYSIEEAFKSLFRELYPLNKLHGSVSQGDIDKVDYIHVFDKLPVEDIIEAYSYLEEGSLVSASDIFDIQGCFTRSKVINELYQKYDMELKLCTPFSFQNVFYRNYCSKITKIYSENWFPSLRISDYSEEIYSNVENKTGMKLNRDINFIPFP